MLRSMIVGVVVLSLICCAGSLVGSAGQFPFTGKPKQLSDEDWKNAQGKSTGDKDLRLADGGHFIGGIDRVWSLVLTGPPGNKFHYSFAMLPGPGNQIQGKYEVKEGLAWFNGTQTKLPPPNAQQLPATPIRFALNYRHVNGKVFFDLLCKDDQGNYLYERKWFRPDAKDWIPLEHHKLTFTPGHSTDKQLKFAVKAELTRWDETGTKPERQVKEITAVYDHKEAYWYESKKQPGWLPNILRPPDGKLSAKELPICFHLYVQHFGQVRGFTFGDPPKWEK